MVHLQPQARLQLFRKALSAKVPRGQPFERIERRVRHGVRELLRRPFPGAQPLGGLQRLLRPRHRQQRRGRRLQLQRRLSDQQARFGQEQCRQERLGGHRFQAEPRQNSRHRHACSVDRLRRVRQAARYPRPLQRRPLLQQRQERPRRERHKLRRPARQLQGTSTAQPTRRAASGLPAPTRFRSGATRRTRRTSR